MVVELRAEPAPAPTPPTHQLVDILDPADKPLDTADLVNSTELIAEQYSRAADEVEDPDDRDRGSPRVEEVSGFDRVAMRAPAPTADPKPQRVREPVRPPDLRRENVAAADPKKAEAEVLVQDRSGGEETPPAEPTARPESVPPLLAAQASSGRVEGGVKRSGLMSFEAMESEIAPYLKVIRQRVERHWRTALHTRYSGASRTRAVLDCAIAPDGHIIEVAIVEPGSSATFAPLCKQAVENAGPFDPFPFEVPEVYRSKNLEIRWTFSFLE